MELHPQTWSSWELFLFYAPKILVSVVCGGLVGLERELKSKPAGIKTNILICMGSAIFTSVSILTSEALSRTGHFGDPARIAAQIVSGIGFLGGGVIIQARGTIVGLTTAATIWTVAAIGIMIGLGYNDVALALSGFVVLTLVSVSFFEDRVLGRVLKFSTEILVDDTDGVVRQEINRLLSQNDLVLQAFDILPSGAQSLLRITYEGHRRDQKNFAMALWGTRGIKEIRQT